MSSRLEFAVSLAAASVAALVSGCTAERVERVASLPEWTVAERPLVEVGDREDGDSVTFYRVDDARWHAGSRALVVADGGAFGLKVYSAEGKLLLQGGRRGRGPGEFSGHLALIEASGDSVGVWDAGQGRWTLFNVVDGGMRNVVGEFPTPTWFEAGMLVVSDAAAAPAYVSSLLMRHADSTDAKVARIDRTGLVFVGRGTPARSWQVFRDSLAPIASMELPPNFTLTHIGEREVVGIIADSVGLEQVAVYPLTRGAHEPADRTPASAEAKATAPRGELRAFLRNMVTAQEMNFAVHGGYTSTADSLQLPPLPEGAEVRILQRTDRGWSGVAWHRATGLTCGMIVGLTPPPGWMEGEARCN